MSGLLEPTAARPLTSALRSSRELDLVGGKAINLARMIDAGFPVPGGFVITTAAFREARGLGMQPELRLEIVERYRRMGSPPVAVRSSATAEDLDAASLAGQYETVLDVRGEDALLAAIERCWASLDTTRTRSYLAHHGIPLAAVAMAVVVQRLVPAEVAGVLFTANPRSGERDRMLVEAAWGLGEGVVSGGVQPDTLVLDAADGTVLEAIIGDKAHQLPPGGDGFVAVAEDRRHVPCLDSAAVDALWRLGRRVADHYGCPQDCEWALHAGEIHLLQARAITTMEAAEAAVAVRRRLRETVAARCAAGAGPWVAHNLGETLPQPTPLSWSVVRRFMSGRGGFGALYRRIGFEPSARAEEEGVLELLGGRIHLDCSRGGELFQADFPFAYDLELLVTRPDAGQLPPTRPVGTLGARLRAARLLGRVAQRLDLEAAAVGRRFRDEAVPAFRRWCEREAAIDLAALDAEALWALWNARRVEVLERFAPESLVPTLALGHRLQQMEHLLAEHCWDCDPGETARALACGEADATLRLDQGLHELAHGRLALADWLADFGHRAPQEFELARPRWHEEPERVRELAAALATGEEPRVLHAIQRERAATLAATLRDQLPPSVRDDFDRLLHALRDLAPLREDAKHELMRGYALLRAVVRECGRRLAVGDDVALLDEDELAAALRLGYAPLERLRRRRLERAAEAQLHLPAVITGEEPALGDPPAIEAGERLAAFALSPGVGTGPVRPVHDPLAAGDLGAGYVLVCRSTDPAWTPLFVKAAGLVLERGGALSHGAVVARELGIPAVVVPDALRLLAAGETVRVDAQRGELLRGLALEAPVASGADATDTRIAPELLPPPEGAIERRGARLRDLAGAGWLAVIAGCYLLPAPWLHDPSMVVMDAALWPLVRALGMPGAVAAIAALMAVAAIALQRVLTDHHRLKTAKRRMKALQAAAAGLDPASPRAAALLAAARPVQGRLTRASLVPLGVLLGPLLLVTLLWFPARVDPVAWAKPPGATAVVTAEVDGAWTGPLRLEPVDPARLTVAPATPAEQAPQPLREPLAALRAELLAERDDPALPWALRQGVREQRARLVAGLDAFLAGPMPSQQLRWELRSASDADGLSRFALHAGDAVRQAAVGFGPAAAPPLTELGSSGDHPVRALTIAYRGRSMAEDQVRPFWAPLGGFDWTWIGVYLLAYVPAMVAARWLFRLP